MWQIYGLAIYIKICICSFLFTCSSINNQHNKASDASPTGLEMAFWRWKIGGLDGGMGVSFCTNKWMTYPTRTCFLMNCDDVVVLPSCIYHLSSGHKHQECLDSMWVWLRLDVPNNLRRWFFGILMSWLKPISFFSRREILLASSCS